MYELLLGWAVLVGISVFVLYVRDPYAVGRHRTRVAAIGGKIKTRMKSMVRQLRSRRLFSTT